MTRQELGQSLSQLKDNKVCVTHSLPFALKLSERKVDAIENGTEDYNLSTMMDYVQMCDGRLEISCYDTYWADNLEELRQALIDARTEAKMSVYQLSRKALIGANILKAFEEGRGYGLRVDSFLKIVNVLNLDITIY